MFDLNSFSLKGKTAIITGGASGLGEYYTKAILKVGGRVLIVSRTDKNWDAMKDYANQLGADLRFFKQDLTAADAPAKIVNDALKEFGQIDILVNNAGMQLRNEWQAYRDEDWNRVVNLNLNAVYFLSHAVAKEMAKQKSGKIINIGSMQSFRAGKYIFPYTASKHGIVGLTKAYADALAPDNIQVNAIAPGYINTPMTKALQEDPVRSKEILEHIPAGHWADPSELMGVVVFLASAASNYITGVTLPVDGGYLLR
ncbi:SDR family NAD(P)-dependent oxidoreductase [Limosilactobacillus caecicola]|uniref:SDR family NAD(P)-dependent oxidoreductase n=1 Tax=Limosilactobacillus caecicola TaxID=2941332 RepID=UPI00203DBA91|nr:SDR family NAD(P)-dependent oxidoreductase [Limosilactobacillus caecicola]